MTNVNVAAKAVKARKSRPRARPGAVAESTFVKWLLIVVAMLFLGIFLIVPLVAVFAQAFDKGLGVYLAAIKDPEALSAIRITLLTAGITVPANLIFGVCAAWAVAKFDFPGKSILLALIDLPFSVSPVIAGLLFVLLFGATGAFGPWLALHNIKIVFAVPSIIIATVFVTFPFVARELIPLMEAQGCDDEEAALALGASGAQTFWRVTLPNVKWGLLYGVILCNARAMGEFGAVSVVSGHIRGGTNTMPLYIQILYSGFAKNSGEAAFAVASLLTFLAVVTLVLKAILERKTREAVPLDEAAKAHEY
jgi:sulfate/thiosulfate transport system permease protein